MLTITFINSEKSKTVISCASYNITEQADCINVRAWDSLAGDIYADFQVGPNNDDLFEVAYVTNLAGKTIDRIGG